MSDTWRELWLAGNRNPGPVRVIGFDADGVLHLEHTLPARIEYITITVRIRIDAAYFRYRSREWYLTRDKSMR